MAEFCEVMRQIKRLCLAHGEAECGTTCPLSDDGFACSVAIDVPNDIEEKRLVEIEHIVMDWAAKHPELRYPTWKEWHDTMFAESFVKEAPCPKFFLDQARGEIMCAESEGCPDCWSNPIPADIAEKLGVKPIGGDNNG